ncbi:hypothetical protein Fmac_006930 [Flemingia macrophylla]|uniref:Myb/SANT-like domain-containing protein n=1 Tax=Flemingia macrophylla TaxID=520843 RepID=A0ABD1NBZ6_9FABA
MELARPTLMLSVVVFGVRWWPSSSMMLLQPTKVVLLRRVSDDPPAFLLRRVSDESPASSSAIFTLLRQRERCKMNRGKAIAPDSSIAVREFTKWTDDMDFRLLTAMLDEARQKSVKDRWREVHDLFSGLSGFACDESTKRFSAKPEVWDDLLTTKPSAAKWRVNLIRYYDLMEELWGVDRAIGHMARTARQARTNIGTSSLRVDLNDDADNIPEEQPFDPGFDTTYRSPPYGDSYSPGDGTQSIPSAASTSIGGTSSSRGTKRKVAMVDVMDAQFDKLTTKLDVFTDYFGRGNDLTQRLSDIVERQVVAIERRNDLIYEQIYVMRRTSTVQYSELYIWDMLVGLNLPDKQIMVQCYDWLCNNSSHVRQLFGLPPHLRLNHLLKLMGASGMAFGSKPTRKRTSKETKGKSLGISEEPTRPTLPSIEHHDRVNQDHGENAEDEDQPMPEEHIADIGQQSSVQYDPQMLSQIWSDIQGLQERLHNLNINVNNGIHGLQEGLNTLTTNVNIGFSTVHTRIEDLEKRFDDFQQSFE